MLIKFFPHSTTYDNEAGIATGSVEVALSPLGKIQVSNLKNAIANEKFDAVFSSDLSRAIETAEGALGDRNKIFVDERLREINIGDFSRKVSCFPHSFAFQHINSPFPGGESYKDVENCIKSFLSDISKTYSQKRIAIFGHQAPQLALEVITKKVPWEEAIKSDWRNTKSFQYGWEYAF